MKVKHPCPLKFDESRLTIVLDEHFEELYGDRIVAPVRPPLPLNLYQLEVILETVRKTGTPQDTFHFTLVLLRDDGEICQVILQVDKAQALRSAGGSSKVAADGTRKSPGPGLEGWLSPALNPEVQKRERAQPEVEGPAEKLLDRVAEHMVDGTYMTQDGGTVHRADVIRMTVDLAEAIGDMARKPSRPAPGT